MLLLRIEGNYFSLWIIGNTCVISYKITLMSYISMSPIGDFTA